MEPPKKHKGNFSWEFESHFRLGSFRSAEQCHGSSFRRFPWFRWCPFGVWLRALEASLELGCSRLVEGKQKGTGAFYRFFKMELAEGERAHHDKGLYLGIPQFSFWNDGNICSYLGTLPK